ncbi:GtrA family protein [Agathobaculum desmolans]|uniref:GtrA family protein n=1 Tax=Agathobaculum desmolans TaxID=39484 RepID=UPI00248E56D3|nr:GtrA family protein [Agathobaculum desmolans]
MKNNLWELIRYGVIGVLTTVVNFAVFYLFESVLAVNANLANVISVICAVIFAYITNKQFVFRSHCPSFRALWREAFSFFSARGITMLIEVGGVFLATTVLHCNAMLSKAAINVIVLILNYVFSKCFVFQKGESGK